ncbi:MAG: cupin-like domain-containing protein [Nannocystaceae bacterium]
MADRVPLRLVGAPSAHAIKTLRSKGLPGVFSGALKDWPAFKRWTPNWLAERFGDARVMVLVRERVTESARDPVQSRHESMLLGNYLRTLEHSDSPGYLAQYPIFDQIPELREHLRFPRCHWSERFCWTNLWCGPAATRSHLHFDQDENFLAQIYGTKHIALIDPSHSHRCYVVNRTWYDAYSPIDPSAPDLDRFPLFAGIPIFEMTLEPGDLLYLPRRWWHDIRALEPSISVNRWWWSPALTARNLLMRSTSMLADRMLKTQRTGYNNGYPFDIRRRP